MIAAIRLPSIKQAISSGRHLMADDLTARASSQWAWGDLSESGETRLVSDANNPRPVETGISGLRCDHLVLIEAIAFQRVEVAIPS